MLPQPDNFSEGEMFRIKLESAVGRLCIIVTLIPLMQVLPSGDHTSDAGGVVEAS